MKKKQRRFAGGVGSAAHTLYIRPTERMCDEWPLSVDSYQKSANTRQNNTERILSRMKNA